MSRDRNKRVRELREKKEAKIPTREQKQKALEGNVELRKEKEKKVLQGMAQILKAKLKAEGKDQITINSESKID